MKQLYVGGNIITMEQENEVVEAVLVENGIITQVGTLETVESLIHGESVERIDLHDKTLMPGFIDPHGHFSKMGSFSKIADLTKCENFADITTTLKAYIKNQQLSNEDYIIGYGYDKNLLKEDRHPTKEFLNKISKDTPVFLFHGGGHTGCTNDSGLRLLGINNETPDADGGYIGRVAGTNEPNGYLEEGSWLPVQNVIHQYTDEEMLELVKDGQDIYIKNGITTVQDGATSTGILELLKTLGEKGDLKVDVVAYPEVANNPRDMELNQAHFKKYHNRLKISGYKLFLDGSPQGKTAWMTEPYEGETSYKGYPWHKDEQVKAYIYQAINENMQLLTHSNGDASSDQLLSNYEAALKESSNPNKHNLRPVMIHCQTVRNDQLDKMGELSMIPSIFVAHTYYWGDAHLKNLGFERGSRISPAKSAFDRSLVVNFHQDAPVIMPDMLETIWCAVNRITKKGVHIGPEESVPPYQALQAVTINAAYAYFEEDNKGSIKAGKLADFVILDKNPLTIDQMKRGELRVFETIKEGETIYLR